MIVVVLFCGISLYSSESNENNFSIDSTTLINFRDSLILNRIELIPVLDSVYGVKFSDESKYRQGSKDSSKIDFTGVKTLSVSLGENNNSSFDQSLKLQAQGQLRKNINLDAKLSDQDVSGSSGIMSTTIQELDQVYAKIFGNEYYLTLGDLNVSYNKTTLGKLNRSGSGVDGLYDNGKLSLGFSAITSKGAEKSINFFGKDGKQTGYYLSGDDFIPIVPASERIWRNGIILIRDKDYSIDYTSGAIDFIGSHIVNNRDEFSVEYQEWTDDATERLNAVNLGFNNKWGNVFWQTNFSWLKLYDDLGAVKSLEKSGNEHNLLVVQNKLDLTSWFRTEIEAAWSFLDTNAVNKDSGDINTSHALLYSISGSAENNLGLLYNYYGSFYDSLYNDVNLRSEEYNFENLWYLDSFNLNDRFKSDEFELAYLWAKGWKLYGKTGYAKAFAVTSDSTDSINRGAYNSLYGQGGLSHITNLSKSDISYSYHNVWDLAHKSKDKIMADAQLNLNKISFMDLIPFSEGQVERYAMSENIIEDFNRYYYSLKSGFRYNNKIRKQNNISSDKPVFGANYNGETSIRLENEAIKKGDNFIDSLKALELLQEIKYRPLRLWNGNLLVQYRELQSTPILEIQGGSENYWLADMENNFGSFNNGWIFNTNYDLSSGEKRPLIAVYNEVPVGTGDFIYDSLENRYIEDLDKGYLEYEGLMTDTNALDYLTRDVGCELSLIMIPKKIFSLNNGVLRDIKISLNGEWMAKDTTDNVFGGGYLPYFSESMMSEALEATVYFNGTLDWSLPDDRWKVMWEPSRSYEHLRGSMEVEARMWEHRFHIANQVFNPLRVYFNFAWSNESRKAGITTNYDAQEIEAYFRYSPWSGLAIEPGVKQKVSTGDYAGDNLNVNYKQFFTRAYFNMMRKIYLNANYSFSQVKQKEGVGFSYSSTDGFDLGYTHRVELGANIDLADFLKLNLRYVLRNEEAASDVYQTMSAEMSAYF